MDDPFECPTAWLRSGRQNSISQRTSCRHDHVCVDVEVDVVGVDFCGAQGLSRIVNVIESRVAPNRREPDGIYGAAERTEDRDLFEQGPNHRRRVSIPCFDAPHSPFKPWYPTCDRESAARRAADLAKNTADLIVSAVPRRNAVD